MDATTAGRPLDPHGLIKVVHELSDKGLKPKEIHEKLTDEGKQIGISTIYIYLRYPREVAR